MIACIVQARVGSTRLPGKVLKEIYEGRTMLEMQLERIKRAKLIDRIIIAIPLGNENLPIMDIAYKNSVDSMTHECDENNLLERYLKTALTAHADVVVRITSDCPLVDPVIIDQVTWRYLENRHQSYYASNCWIPNGFPIGMDVEVFGFQALEDVWRVYEQAKKGEVKSDFQLGWDEEHVTTYIRRYPLRFHNVEEPPKKIVAHDATSGMENFPVRLCVDYQEDFDLVKSIYEKLYPREPAFGIQHIWALWKDEPDLFKVNEKYTRRRS